MHIVRISARAALAVAVGLSFSGCETVHHNHHANRGYGPPPHAPAHGYRHKHQSHGHELVYDSGLGVYVVVGLPDVYFQGDYYYRFLDGVWKVSLNAEGPWEYHGDSRVPPGLRKSKGGKGNAGKNNPGQGRGRGKNK